MLRTGLLLLIALTASARPARAQTAQPPVAPKTQPNGCNYKWSLTSFEAHNIDEVHTRLVKDVQIDCNEVQLFADEAELWTDIDRLRASGNVVFVSGGSRIAAERMEFNTKTKTGTFYTASGIVSMEGRGIERSLFGTQEPDAYFYGETVEKIGPKTYKITHGGFTTCVQPTPRWEFVANSVTLTLEKRALLSNAVLKVKDVPVFYLPGLYYPINKEDRATGFLIPIYGTSTIKGQMIKNAFFWAMNRSQDATFYHDFFSKTGQGFGGEYRYVQSATSSGNMQTYVLREHDATYEKPDGTQTLQPGINSYQITGGLVQSLGTHIRLTGNANYFSSLVAQQRYQQNLFAATNRTRSFGINASGNWGANSVSGTVERNEIFSDVTNSNSNTTGSFPRINFTRAEKKIPGVPLYYGANSEFVTLIRTDKAADTVKERGLTRLDVFPSLRFPFTKWPFLTFNSSLGFRETYWTDSQVGEHDPTRVPDSVFRRYFTMGTTITGPVLTRIWNTPGRVYAQKFKHVIEPTVTLQRTTAFDSGRIVSLESADYVKGGVTSMTYGLNNRLYAKRENAREILTVSVLQTYYSEASASVVDQRYQSTFNPTDLLPTNFSPIAVQAHVSPTAATDASVRAEYDAHVGALRTLAASGGLSLGWVTSNATWSLSHSTPKKIDEEPITTSHALGANATVRRPGNAFSGTYAFNYDVLKQAFVNQRIIGNYNTQCCGIAVEFQKYNFGQAASAVGVPRDRRFNISFTLAGIGTFSDIFGAFGGQQNRR